MTRAGLPGYRVRAAEAADADGVADLAEELAQSFQFSRESFRRNYPGVLAASGACLLLAEDGGQHLALATRRAAPFYRALGYQESATYFRKLL